MDAHIQAKISLVIKDEAKHQYYDLNCCDMTMARQIANQEIDRRMALLQSAAKDQAQGPSLGTCAVSQERPLDLLKYPAVDATLPAQKESFRQSCVSESFTYNVSQDDTQDQQ